MAFSSVASRAVKQQPKLTLRQREIMNLVSKGLTNKQIARHLSLSEGTIKVHLHVIFNTVGVANRTELAAFALREQYQAAAVDCLDIDRLVPQNLALPIPTELSPRSEEVA
jgi:two-component system, NarL family, nitrate/nitrite response regulator NarL